MCIAEVTTYGKNTKTKRSDAFYLRQAYEFFLERFDISARMLEVKGRGKRIKCKEIKQK